VKVHVEFFLVLKVDQAIVGWRGNMGEDGLDDGLDFTNGLREVEGDKMFFFFYSSSVMWNLYGGSASNS
jgi:hypothetical protein